MKARHRIQRLITAFFMQQVEGTKRNEALSQVRRPFAVFSRLRLFQKCLYFSGLCVVNERFRFTQLLAKPLSKSGYRRKSCICLEMRQTLPEVLDHLLDQRTAKRYAAKTRLAVGDGIKDGAVG